jgi:predicted DCC family thiol-disulfide oxidoreductase YuxK
MKENNAHIILFDGICNMCCGIVQFIIKKDPGSKFKFAPLQSAAGQDLLKIARMPLHNFNTFVYFRHGKMYTESTAALILLKEIGGKYSLFYGLMIFPKLIRDTVYRLISKSRYTIWGKADQCMIPNDGITNRFLR